MFEWLRRLIGRPSYPRIETDRSPGWVYSQLRHDAFSRSRTDLGLPESAPDSPVWCVMEIGYPSGTATVVACSGGATSFYGSDGCFVIGGEFHEQVVQANAKLLETAHQLIEHLVPREEWPVPAPWETIFYVRTEAGIFGLKAATRDLDEDRHVLSPLYHAGEDVLKHIREQAKAQQKKRCANASPR